MLSTFHGKEFLGGKADEVKKQRSEPQNRRRLVLFIIMISKNALTQSTDAPP